MLAKKNRLITRVFDRSFRKKLFRLNTGDFSFIVAKDFRETPKFAVSVSKKNFKSAVKRNRLRRQIYEFARLNLIDKFSHKNVICFYTGKNELANSRNFLQSCQILLKKIT